MKICPTCGTQLDDYVVYCPTCGTTLAAPAAPANYAAPVTYAPAAPATYAPAAPAVAPAPEKTFFPVMTLISKLLIILCITFSGCGLIYGYISYYSSLWTDATCSILSLLTAIGSFVFALIGFIQALANKAGGEKIFSAIVQWVASTAAVVVGIIMVCNMY